MDDEIEKDTFLLISLETLYWITLQAFIDPAGNKY